MTDIARLTPARLHWRHVLSAVSYLLIVFSAAGCQESGLNAQASPSSGSPDAPLVLEFDLPDEFRNPADSPAAVIGFRIGFFRPDDDAPLQTVDVARDGMSVTGLKARVVLPREGLPKDLQSLAIRVQTLSGNQSSAWSEPAPLVGQPARPRNTAPPQRRGLALADVATHPALGETLKKVLPQGASAESVLKGFRRLDDLALAVVVSRDLGIPFTALAETLQGPPRVSMRNAIRKLKPDMESARTIRDSRAAARQLLAQPVPRTP